jgi:hypothetical protein
VTQYGPLNALLVGDRRFYAIRAKSRHKALAMLAIEECDELRYVGNVGTGS